MKHHKVNLKDAFWFQEGPGVRRWQFTNEGIKLLNVSNILKDGSIDLSKTDRHLSVEEVESKYSHFLVDAGDLVIASSGVSIDDDGFLRTRGAFIEKNHLPLCMNTSTIRFKAKENVSDLRFLKHWLQSYEFRIQITREVTGIAQKNFGPSHLKRIELTLPPLEQQKRIADILDAADALRVKRRQVLEQLDELVQSVFLEMFGDPVTNPKGWEVVKVDAIGSVQGGLQVTPKRRSLPIKHPYLRVANVFRGYLDLSEVKKIGMTEAEEHRTMLENQDILIVEGHGNKEEIGRCSCWDNSIRPCVHQNHLIRLRCHREKMNPVFVEHYINSPGGRRELTGTSRTTSGLNTISVSKVKAASIKHPPLELQNRFAEIVSAIEAQKGRVREHLVELDALFASLQQQAFSGEL